MQIIHLSDTHIGKNNNKERFDMLIRDMQANDAINLADCVVVHTGDLLKDGKAKYRKQALESLKKLSVLVKKLILCPGNHDCGGFWGVSKSQSEYFMKDFSDFIFHDQPTRFPVQHDLDDKYMFIGLDSNLEEVDNLILNFGAEGDLGASQRYDLEIMLNNENLNTKKCIIYLHHHPFHYRFNAVKRKDNFKKWLFYTSKKLTMRFRRMKDADNFCSIIENKANIILFGHKHEGLDCSSESIKYGIPMALDAGTSTASDNMKNVMTYRIIDPEKMTFTVRSIKL